MKYLKHMLKIFPLLILICILFAPVMAIINTNRIEKINAYIDNKNYTALEKEIGKKTISRIPLLTQFYYIVFDKIPIYTPLLTAVANNDEKATKILLENGAAPNFEWSIGLGGNTAIEYASGRKNINIIRMLIEHGADVEKYGFEAARTFLHQPDLTKAEVEAYFEIMTNNGLDLNLKKDGYTLLRYAVLYINIEAVRYLVDKGLDLYSLDDEGRSMLHATVWAYTSADKSEKRICIIEFLLEKGVFDKSYKDNCGKTAYDYALERGHTEAAELLKP